MANVFTNMSPRKVAVSFTHVDKAHRELKPATDPVLVSIFLGQVIFLLCPTYVFPSFFATAHHEHLYQFAVTYSVGCIVSRFNCGLPVKECDEGNRITNLQLSSMISYEFIC